MSKNIIVEYLPPVGNPAAPTPRSNLPAAPPLPKPPLREETVKRILKRQIESYIHFGIQQARIVRWDIRRDGTTVGVVEDEVSGIRYHWSICPTKFCVVTYGPIDD